MEFVVSIDAATRVLIDAALAEATEKAADERTLAMLQGPASEGILEDVTVIQRLFDKWEAGTDGAEDEMAMRRKRLEDRIKKLDGLCHMAKSVRKHYAAELKSLAQSAKS